MAYIEITDAMIERAGGVLFGERPYSPAIVRAALTAAAHAAEIRTEPTPTATAPHVVVWINGDESIRCEVGGPPVEFGGEAKTIQVARR